MSLVVLLDAGPLGMITNPKSSSESEACKDWLASLAYNGAEVVIPEIADYEVRRELLRAGKQRGLGGLDALKGDETVIATTNGRHLALFPVARNWREVGQQWNTVRARAAS